MEASHHQTKTVTPALRPVPKAEVPLVSPPCTESKCKNPGASPRRGLEERPGLVLEQNPSWGP